MKRRIFFAALFAASLLRAAGALSPERAAVILSGKNAGLAQLEEGKNAEAKAAFLKLATLVPGEPLPIADAAVAALRAGDVSGAEKLLARAMSLEAPRADLWMIAAAIENAKNRPEEMRSALSRAAALSSTQLEARWRWVRSAEVDPAMKGKTGQSETYLKEILQVSPANVPALVKLLLLVLESPPPSAARATASRLEAVISPMEPRIAKFFSEGIQLMNAGSAREASLKFRIVENLLRVTDRYRQSLAELYTDVVGLPLTSFSPAFEESLRPRAGRPVPVSFVETPRLAEGLSPERFLRHADLKNSGTAEDYAIPAPFRRAAFFDFDADGDLDIYLYGSGGPDKLLRNNADGTWTDVTAETGDPGFSSARVAVEDLDRDGDLDLVSVTPSGKLLWRSNLRQGRFETIDLGVDGAVDVAVADLDADGLPDLAVATRSGMSLLINRGGGKFERVPGGDLAKLPPGFVPRRVAAADLDNDGFPDLVVGGEAGLLLFRNAGLRNFTTWSAAPRGVGRVDEVVSLDVDRDGDLDLLLDEAGRTRAFSNEGGNANGWLDVTLQGLSAGSQKVNRAGVGSIVEVKAGDLYGAQTVSLLPTHFGLGPRRKADVVRVAWTNGVPQNLFDQKSGTVVREVQQLKGSCPFVYAKDGRTGQWNFVSDALGRAPLGLLYDGIHLAGADPREWLKIGGELLSPGADGKLMLEYTEELWEACFLDLVRLIAVDHPAGTDFAPNERMVPGVLEKRIFTIAQRRPLRAAWAGGADVADLLARKDHRYVAPGEPTAYQGIRTEHDLVLDLGPISAGDRVVLYLNGWIFYTDTSINVSISQRHDVKIVPPVLEVPDGLGGWRTALASFGFPAGKTKTMPVDLTGLVNPEDPRVRIRTNLAIYWDEIFLTVNDPPVEVRMTELPAERAQLAFRGFSRRYRDRPDGPELFDHDDVSKAPQWADVPGLLTRYGDVTELLGAADDRSVAFAGGDAIRLQFDAERLPQIPPAWVRDYILVSDGWDKDFDKNTVTGTAIGPYPFHAMSAYPYPAGEEFPDSQFLRDWVTRPSSPERFWSFVRDYGGPPIR